MLSMAREAFVDALSAVPRKSAAMEAILVFNRGSQEAAVWVTARTLPYPAPERLGLRENAAQFALLVVINAFVGAMVGMERSILPLIAEREFGLVVRTGVLSFILVFGLSKALTNYAAGRLADRFGRKQVLVGGWLVATPVPFILMWAPTWTWILIGNGLLGISQGLTWSATVIMKIDLVGSERRGLAMGLNEFAGYVAAAAAALATGWIAAQYGFRPQPFYLGVAFVVMGLGLSALLVRETTSFVALESQLEGAAGGAPMPREVFWRTSLGDRNLSAVSQAGLVNNLNDGMAWGLLPLVFAGAHMNLRQIGTLAAIYPGTWGVAQLGTGALSDRVGRKWLIAWGMWVQAIGLVVIGGSATFLGFATGGVLLGLGTAMVYPTLLATIGDVAAPSWRSSAVGVYRLWRDLGYVIGALVAGFAADTLGFTGAIWLVAAVTIGSGVVTALRMTETLHQRTV
jgi:MFS family permease